MRVSYLNISFLVLLVSCASTGKKNYDDGSITYQHARTFDAYVQGKLDADQVTALQRSCRKKKSENPFCYSIRRAKYLFRYQRKKKRVVTPPQKKKARAIKIKFSKKGNPLNVWTLRRKPVKNLLAGFNELTQEQVLKVGEVAVRQKCPNRLAVAAAATLEDYLPNPEYLDLIGRLYVKGAYCSRSRSADREHFFTRAGLMYWMKKDYNTALKWFSKSRPTDAFSGRSLYWRWRAEVELGQTAKAEKTLARLLGQLPFSFHAMVAAMRSRNDLGMRLLTEKAQLPTRSKRSPNTNRLIAQAEILKKYGFEQTGGVIASWILGSYRRIEPEIKAYVAELGDAYTKVTTLPMLLLRYTRLRTKQTMTANYPRAYYNTFERHDSGVDPYLLMALARKESEFNPIAISVANAQGLLQINPDTGQRLTGGRPVNLLDLETNIKLGAKYFRSLMKRYDSKPFLALAAYNAGERAADRWVRRYPKNDAVLFVDLISYRETRNYVGFVLNNYYWYRRIYEDNTQQAVRKRIALDR